MEAKSASEKTFRIQERRCVICADGGWSVSLPSCQPKPCQDTLSSFSGGNRAKVELSVCVCEHTCTKPTAVKASMHDY